MKNAFADLEAAFPSEWDRLPFWASYRRIKRPATGTEELLSVYRDYGVIRKSDRDDNFNKASDDLTTYQVVRPGDLVINKMKAWQGSVAVSQLGGIVSPAYFVFSPVQTNVPQFMHYLLRSAPYIEAYRAVSKGIRPNQWDLDPDMLRTFPMPTPSIELQQQTAEFLDRETAEIDAFIADQEELIGLLAERRAATISHAVTRGLDPSVPMKDSGVKWLGEMPVHWRTMSLRRVLRRIVQGVSPQADGGLAHAGSVGVLRAGCVNRGVFNELEHKRLPDGFEFDDSIRVQVGDLVVNRASGSPALVGSAARVRELNFELILSDKTFRLDPNSLVDLDFLELYLNSTIYRRQVLGAISGAEGLANNLPVSALRAMLFAMPTVSEQRQIAATVRVDTAEFDAALADARTAIALSRERRVALISAAVTGKVDVRETA